MPTPSAIDPQLLASYVTARYVVALPTGECACRIGVADAALGAAIRAAGVTRAALVGAENPRSAPADAQTNARATAVLADAIDAAGLARVPARGEDPTGRWAPERGFCVFGASDALLDAWLVRFDQNAFVGIDVDGRPALILHPDRRA
ncbi:MAG: DUF3293 domain-containing protein [Burkholderiales bacterium]|nr:DUF3293 domain-containing protein [Burkholderiales bacterium]